MRIFPPKSIYLFFGILSFCACSGEDRPVNQTSNATNSIATIDENANVAKDDVTELERIISLPFEPDESSVWRELDLKAIGGNRVSSPNDRKLIAILKFTAEETLEIVKRAETHKAAVPAVLDVESWYPPELIAQSGNSGDKTLKGNSYAADDFIKTPFTGGKLTRIDNTDFFILELTTF